MRKGILVLVVVLVLALSVGSFAFQNEPDGFRGLKWGDPPPGEDMEDWRKLLGRDNLLCYERKNDKLKIGGAKLESIEYQFYKGQFMAVRIETQRGNHELLEDVVKLNFGPGYSEDYSSGEIFGIHYEFWSCQWSGDIATVILTIELYYYREGHGYLTIRSAKIYDQYQEDERRQEEEEVRHKEEERQKATKEGLADF